MTDEELLYSNNPEDLLKMALRLKRRQKFADSEDWFRVMRSLGRPGQHKNLTFRKQRTRKCHLVLRLSHACASTIEV